MKPILLLLTMSLPLSAAVVVNLPGTAEKSTWVFNSTNYPTVTYNSFGTAANPWGAPAAPTGGTSSALLTKISGSGYMSGSGFMYTAGADGTFRLYDDSPLASLQTLVLQGGISDEPTGAPVLNLNGGSQAIPAGYQVALAGTPYQDRVWQWDLSGISEPITSYEILFSGHFAITTLQIDAGSSFVQVVPEPSACLSVIAAMGLTLFRRRRA